MSHKTLYIDVDEEITSIVDRVRKAQATEVIVVVPKQAMLIQSLVNLKLLKKEADRRKKKVMIVTQDRIGKKLIEKAGITVQKKALDDTQPEDEDMIIEMDEKRSKRSKKIFEEAEEQSDIGSSDFFEKTAGRTAPAPREEDADGNITNISFGTAQKEKSPEKNENPEKAKSEEKIPEEKKFVNEKISMSDIVAGPKSEKKKQKKKKVEMADARKKAEPPRENYFSREAQRQKSVEMESYFTAAQAVQESPIQHREEKRKIPKVKSGSKKYFFWIVLIMIIAIGSAFAAYKYLAKATLVLQLESKKIEVSADIKASTGNVGADLANASIPAAHEKISIEKSADFAPSGGKTGAGKASGTVVIYNEFSADPQPLVATTRLATPDGKIFRITKNIDVPGMTQVAGENKPGAIEVEVTADQTGDQYNIGASDFTIVGFKGGPKYDKIYAKSAKPMTGADSGGSGSGTVSATDIANAKEKLLAQAKQDAISKLHESLGADRKFFEDGVQITLRDSSSSETIGAKVEKFNYRINADAEALSYSESDVKKMLAESAGLQNGAEMKFNLPISYILANADLAAGEMSFSAKTDADAAAAFDVENFRHNTLGKNSAELSELLKNFPVVQDAQVSFSPFFVNRVPLDEKHVVVEIK